MPIEIERKFLVVGEAWRAHVVERKHLRQAYLARQGKASIRVRVADDAKASLTIKSRGARTSRLEFEYDIPVSEALTLIELRDGHVVEKVRHLVRHDGLTWEVDVFTGDNAGLVIAEIELDHEAQTFSRPAWLGPEVTHDERFANSRLARFPFSTFADDLAAERGLAV